MSAYKSTGLGRGFDTLLPSDFDPGLLVDETERIQNVLITKIIANPEQPRKTFDSTALEELAISIRRFGILQPLILSPAPGNGYIIVAGERRFRAARIAGLKTVPAIVRERKKHEQLQIALIENVQRVDLSPIDTAISIEKLHQQFNLSYTEIAKSLGKADTTISNIVRLLNLPPEAREALQLNKISEGHARAILAIKRDTAAQAQLLHNIVGFGWSVRQAEQFVSAHKHGAKSRTAVQKRMAITTPETERISKRLNTAVTIKHTARGGRLEIHFKTDQELETIVQRLQTK